MWTRCTHIYTTTVLHTHTQELYITPARHVHATSPGYPTPPHRIYPRMHVKGCEVLWSYDRIAL